MDSKIERLDKRVALAHLGGGEERIEKQKEKKNVIVM